MKTPNELRRLDRAYRIASLVCAFALAALSVANLSAGNLAAGIACSATASWLVLD